MDFPGVDRERARSNSPRLLPAGRFEFQVGTLLATGVPADAADGLMCVDAVQFADPPLAGLLECRRVLVSDGRLVLTCWEAVDPSDERVSPSIRG